MLNRLPEAGQLTSLVIRPGNRSGLSADRLAGIGNRPVVELLQIDGKTVEWPATVSLRYEAKADERADQALGMSMPWEDPHVLCGMDITMPSFAP